MNVIKNELIRPFDVDGTLILHVEDQVVYVPSIHGDIFTTIPTYKFIDVKDPVTGGTIQVARHEPMIRLLDEELHRGAHILLWSRGGYEWAHAVILALGYNPHDSRFTIMSKPLAYFDDIPVDKWMTDRIYLEPDTIYKRISKGAK